MPRPGSGRVAALVLACGYAVPSTTAPASAQEPSIHDLAFMTGCWEGSFRARDGAEGVIEEHYTSPADNVMLGTTRYQLHGAAVQFELTTIRQEDGGVFLHPYPGGEPSPARFRFERSDGNVAVFEAPEHDFPKRIRYERVGLDELHARVDDGTDSGDGMQWQLARVECPAGST